MESGTVFFVAHFTIRFSEDEIGRRDLPRVVSKKDGKNGHYVYLDVLSCWNLGSMVRINGL